MATDPASYPPRKVQPYVGYDDAEERFIQETEEQPARAAG